MQGYMLDWALHYLKFVCLYAERGVLMFQKKWYESEIKYLEQQIALLERDA
jgi:hypothetical protein